MKLLGIIFILSISFVTAFKPTIRSSKCVNIQLKSHNGNIPSTDSVPVRVASISKSKLQTLAIATSALISSQLISSQVKAEESSSLKSPIVVLGSNGKTGKLLVDQLAAKGIAVRPTYRNVASQKALDKPNVDKPTYADVTKIETLESAIAGASVVVFAASASNKGGNAGQVDYQGVVNTAKECLRLKIPKLIIISSGAITRPDSLGFKITNLFGGIMDYKLKGENELRALYETNEDKSLSYIIIRPGGLLDGEPAGPSGIELNQGDTISGEINRADVAECTVAAAISTTIPKNVIFEIYSKDKKGPLQGNFKETSGYERRGNTYDEMFSGLKSGVVNI